MNESYDKKSRMNPIMRMEGDVWREYVRPKVSLFDQIESLPETEKLVLALHYYEGLSFSEIGFLMEVEEHNVCAIHAQALTTLGVRLDNTSDTRS